MKMTVLLSRIIQGDLNFEPDGDHVQIPEAHLLDYISQLLHVSRDELLSVLTSRVVAAGGEVVRKQHTLEGAFYARDAFAKVRRYLSFFRL